MADTGFQLRPRSRKLWVCIHVVVSVGWLGLDLALLVLGLTGLLTRNPEQLRAAYLAMGIFGDVLVVPIALATLVSGVVLSVGTRWGLVRYRWVLLKLVLTLVVATASVFALRSTIGAAVKAVSGVPTGVVADVDLSGVATDLVIQLSAALVIYTFCTVVSVVKPWGRTRFAKRARARQVSRTDRSQEQARSPVTPPPAVLERV